MNEIRIKPCQPARSRPVKSCGGWQRKTRFPPPAPLPTTPPFSRQPYPSFWPKRNKQLKKYYKQAHAHTHVYIYIYIRAWTFSLTCITHSATLSIYYPYIYLLFTFTALYRLFLFFFLLPFWPRNVRIVGINARGQSGYPGKPRQVPISQHCQALSHRSPNVALGVGKTSLVVRYISKTFSPNSTSTIGASFMTKKLYDILRKKGERCLLLENGILTLGMNVYACRTVDNCKVRLQIWDTAGQG